VNRRLALVALGCVGLAIGIWWYRFADVPGVAAESERPTVTRKLPAKGASGPAADAEVSARSAHIELPPKSPGESFAEPAAPTELPVRRLADARMERSRQQLWIELRSFAAEAELTTSQWERFLGDLSDLAVSETTAYTNALEEHESVEEAARLNDELGRELEQRCTLWMTDEQLAVFRFRLHSGLLISTIRRLKMFESLG